MLQMQVRQLLHCNVVVYHTSQLAYAWETLRDTGFEGDEMTEYPIDETMSVREFEMMIEDRFNISLELSNQRESPFSNKSLKLYQLTAGNTSSPGRECRA
ncbi:hypothetical protein GCM10023143_03990 [Compostibacter hankyongensis]|uniref:Acyl carrier protein n=1 Tax=Compostibacter hankyongensis TaxID=1007089 RepID=A0ABP8FF44_9BACT